MRHSASATEAGQLHIHSRVEENGVAVVALTGEADLHTAPALRDALQNAMGTGIAVLVVDLTSVTFIDSMMLGVLLGATRRARESEIETRIVVDDPHVRRIFELTLLDRVLSLYPSIAPALER